jgi:hypothetical protein
MRSRAKITGWEDTLLYLESDTAAFIGHLAKSKDLTQRAVESARKADEKEEAVAMKRNRR